MSHTTPPDGPNASREELLQWFAETFGTDLASADPAAAMSAISSSNSLTGQWSAPREPLRLAAAPEAPLSYTLKVTLNDSKPPIWRRISVPSDLTLDVFHDVLQAAMGWTNSHLHKFTPGTDRHGTRTQSILSDWDVAEGEEGVPETDLRLDALLVQARDRLFYWYDFGDDWHHTILLEKVEPRRVDDRDCACITGKRACPPENIGGIHFYNTMFDAAEDSDDPEHEWAADVLAQLHMTRQDAEHFDVELHDDAMRRATQGAEALQLLLADPGAHPSAIIELFEGLGHDAARWVAGFVDAAQLDDPVEVNLDEALAATSVIRAVLDHVGDAGVALTAAGYLKPASVTSLMAELDPQRQWIGASTVESHTQPLLDAREVITRLGLLRKQHGRLLLTKTGAKLRTDPVGLWWHVARRLPMEKPTEGRSAAVFLLLRLAAGTPVENSLRAELDLFMDVLGWQFADRGTHSPRGAWWYVIDRTQDVLGWASTGRLFTPREPDAKLDASASRLMARAALARNAQH